MSIGEKTMLARLIAFAAVPLCATSPLRADDVHDWVKDNLQEIVELYRAFHRNPELSFEEKETAARLADNLESAGYEVTRGVGGHGVVALLKNGDGPTLMLRADLDALPVTEQTGLVYGSKVKVKHATAGETGVMHACGHDIHIANLIGVGRYMAQHEDRWSGTLMLIGQPAEERGAGATAMLKDGLFKRFPKPDLALALHVDAQAATGKVGYRAGYVMANVDSVEITIIGRGGHGAFPSATIDPIVIAARLILDLQTIVSRETKPIDPAVVTVGSIHAGTKSNIIPSECQLQLTVRSYTPEVRKLVLDAIRRKAKAAAASSGAPEPKIEMSDSFTPALRNDRELVERVVPVFKKVLGDDNVFEAEQSMGGEDFGQYGLAGVPIFMYRLGSVDPKRLEGYVRVEQPPPSLHSPVYYPDAEATLSTGIITMSAAALELLGKGK